VVGEQLEAGSEQIMAPGLQRIDHREELLLTGGIIAFGGRQLPGVVRDRTQTALRVSLHEDRTQAMS